MHLSQRFLNSLLFYIEFCLQYNLQAFLKSVSIDKYSCFTTVSLSFFTHVYAYMQGILICYSSLIILYRMAMCLLLSMCQVFYLCDNICIVSMLVRR